MGARRTLASASADATVLLWDLGPLNDLRGDLVDRACAIAGRGLTQQEWATYLPAEPYQDTCAASR